MIRSLLLVPLITAAAGLAAIAAEPPSPRSAAPDPANGRRIAEEGTAGTAACSSCHGLNGTGNAQNNYPRLAGQSAAYLHKQLLGFAGGDRRNAVMTPIAQALSDQDKADAAAYYAAVTMAEAPLPQPPQAQESQLRLGAQLATAGSAERSVQACNNCHGPQGTGLAPDFPRLAGQYASYMQAQFAHWRDGSRKNDPLALMRNITAHLNEEDVRAVSLYYASVRPETEEAPQMAETPR